MASCAPEDGVQAPQHCSRSMSACSTCQFRNATELHGLWHARDDLLAPEDGTHVPAPQTSPCTPNCPSSSSAPSRCWWAALSSVLATPSLLRGTPSGHPVGVSCVAVIWRRGGTDWRASTALTGASLAMHTTAPSLLAYRPASLPIRESVGAVVRIGGSRWGYRHRWRRYRLHWRQDRLRASEMMHPATPSLLVSCPSIHGIHCAVEGVHWPRRPGLCWRLRGWQRGLRRGRRRGRRRGWRRGRLSGQCCGWLRCGAANASSRAAEILLLLRPHVQIEPRGSHAIVHLGRAHASH